MRLGEYLVHAGAITADDLDAALRQQVVYGGRLGTNLIELGAAEPDTIAHALARLLHVPASLERHFQTCDPAARERIPRDLAARYGAFPIAFADTHAGRRLVVCMRNPRDQPGVDALTAAAGVHVLACVAPELELFYWLEQGYGIQRPQRYRQARPGREQPLPRGDSDRMPAVSQVQRVEDFEVDVDLDGLDDELAMPDSLQLVELDHGDVERDFSQYSVPQGRERESLLDIAEAARRSATPATDGPELDFDAAVHAIQVAANRADVGDAVVGFLRARFGAGLMVIAKQGVAMGHRGCGGAFDDATVESILIPLTAPSMFRVAFEAGKTCRGAPPSGGKAIQDRFFKLFPLPAPPTEVVVTPVSIRNRVVSLIYAHAPNGAALDEGAVQELEAVAATVSDSYLRLIRDAKRT
jgi:hypothetical protein